MTSNPCSGDGLGQPAAVPGYSHIELSYVTTFYFNQTDSSLVLELLRRYASYSGDLLDRLQFLLVDDGPIPVAARRFRPHACSRILVDVPWAMRPPGISAPSMRARTSSC
jgi:hypothetical protein